MGALKSLRQFLIDAEREGIDPDTLMIDLDDVAEIDEDELDIEDETDSSEEG